MTECKVEPLKESMLKLRNLLPRVGTLLAAPDHESRSAGVRHKITLFGRERLSLKGPHTGIQPPNEENL